jgi:hypothetical protein
VFALSHPTPYHPNMGIRQRSSNGRAVRSADTVAQDWRAWDLRCQHLTYREIGAELGIDPSTAYDEVQRAAQMIPTEGAAEMKQAMLDEMDRMSRHLWSVVGRQQSNDGPGLQAIAQLLRVQERKARLMGLDAPKRRAVDVITHDMFMEAIADLEAEVARMEADPERES